MNWKLNASTGDFIARVTETRRLIRIGRERPYFYKAEEWGDYSLDFPKSGNWNATPAKALKSLEKRLESDRS